MTRERDEPLVFKAHRFLHHSTLGSKVIKKKKRTHWSDVPICRGVRGRHAASRGRFPRPLPPPSSPHPSTSASCSSPRRRRPPARRTRGRGGGHGRHPGTQKKIRQRALYKVDPYGCNVTCRSANNGTFENHFPTIQIDFELFSSTLACGITCWQGRTPPPLWPRHVPWQRLSQQGGTRTKL